MEGRRRWRPPLSPAAAYPCASIPLRRALQRQQNLEPSLLEAHGKGNDITKDEDVLLVRVGKGVGDAGLGVDDDGAVDGGAEP